MDLRDLIFGFRVWLLPTREWHLLQAARAYGRIFAAVQTSGRRTRRRLADLLIAATATAHGLTLYTRNPSDLEGLDEILDIEAV